MKATFPLVPGSVLGLMGGGQLGKMFAQAATRMGYHVACLERAQCPAFDVSRHPILARSYEDPKALAEMKSLVAAVTTEFENVPAAALETLSEGPDGCFTAPQPDAVRISQDRWREKEFLSKVAQVPTAPYCHILTTEDALNAPKDLFPGVLKTAEGGYDGKGQAVVKTPTDATEAFARMGGVPCILEKMLDLALEVSVIVCRNRQGQSVTFPVFENHHRDGILAETVFPARIPQKLHDEARAYADRIAERLHYCGVLCIEFFVLKDGSLRANETAPRPHNSGHVTIEAALTSQYEEQVRAMTGMPLGPTDPICHGVMLNILGDAWYDENDQKREPAWAGVLALPGVKLHLYGKEDARKKRKMGHVTCLGETLDIALARAKAAAQVLHLPEPK